MPGPEGVVGAFFPVWKTAQATFLPDAVKGFPPSGQDFMPVGLVAHIPDQAVIRGVEDIVQGDGELHHPQGGAQVPFLDGDHIDDKLP